jgi:hypothetical protein
MRKTALLRLARRLISCYPRAWRTRYAAELFDVLQARPLTWGDVGNLALHAVYTHLHPDLLLTGDESLEERVAGFMRTVRTSELAIFWAFVVSMIAWLQFGGLVDGGPYMPLTASAGAWPIFGVHPANGLSAALAVQSAATDVALLAVLAGGVPLAVAAWRHAPSVRRYFLVPVLAFLGAVLPVPIAFVFRGPVATINLTFSTPFTDAYFLWFVALAAVSAWALCRVISASDIDGRLVRYAFWPSFLVTIALLLLLSATVAWGLAAHQEVPRLFDRSDLIIGHVTATTWAIDVGMMAVAALVALVATIRGTATRTAISAV